VCGLWYLPLQAAYAVAIVQRVARSVVSDLLNLDSWTAATINRRLTEQWAWDSLDLLRDEL